MQLSLVLAPPPVPALSLGGMSVVLFFAVWKYARTKLARGAPNS